MVIQVRKYKISGHYCDRPGANYPSLPDIIEAYNVRDAIEQLRLRYKDAVILSIKPLGESMEVYCDKHIEEFGEGCPGCKEEALQSQLTVQGRELEVLRKIEVVRESKDVSIYCHRKSGLDSGFSVQVAGDDEVWDKTLMGAIEKSLYVHIKTKEELENG